MGHDREPCGGCLSPDAWAPCGCLSVWVCTIAGPGIEPRASALTTPLALLWTRTAGTEQTQPPVFIRNQKLPGARGGEGRGRRLGLPGSQLGSQLERNRLLSPASPGALGGVQSLSRCPAPVVMPPLLLPDLSGR